MNAGPVALPNATTLPRAVLRIATSVAAFLNGVTAVTSLTAAAAGVGVVGAATVGWGGEGAGHNNSPFLQDDRATNDLVFQIDAVLLVRPN
jgi:hypothetical protein